jgi:hypothetical protein
VLQGTQLKHSKLLSLRYIHYRELLDGFGKDPRHLIFALHHDSFCPFVNDKDYTSIGYLLLRLLASSSTSMGSQFVRLWLANDGHIKSFEPMLDLLEVDATTIPTELPLG